MATNNTINLLYHIENLALQAKASGMKYNAWLKAWNDSSVGGNGLERDIRQAARDLKEDYNTYEFVRPDHTPANQAYRAWMNMWPASSVRSVTTDLRPRRLGENRNAGRCRVSPRRTGGASPRRYNARSNQVVTWSGTKKSK